MSLQSVLVGALPDLEVQLIVAKPTERTKRKNRGRPGKRKRWTSAAIAKRIGVDESAVYRRLRDDPKFRALLRWDEVSKEHDHLECHEVDAAAEYLVAILLRWSREHDACVECQRDDSRHVGNGVCERCTKRRKRGWRPVPFPGAWDRTRGHERCLGCHTNDRPHYRGGLCEPCDQWARRTGWRSKSKTERAREAARRRKRLRKRKGR